MTSVFQVVDVRVAGNRNRHFLDAAQEAEHQQRLQAFRAAIPRSVRYVVGPDASIQVRGGRVLQPGSPITVDDVDPDPGFPEQGRAAWQVLAGLLHDERVVENYQWVPPLPQGGSEVAPR